MTTQLLRYWAIIPAAGIGSRMASELPKQYLKINNKTILQHSIDRLLKHDQIDGVVVALSAQDQTFDKLSLDTDKTLLKVIGGKERCHSVLNALTALLEIANKDDWVLVHDAARPCIRQRDISKLIAELENHSVGGLLGYPVRDTMKRCDENNLLLDTVDRHRMWHALTPQMFHLRALFDALNCALQNDYLVTDEASAMEYAGFKPKMILGQADNIKITRPEDLKLAEFYLSQIAE